MSTSNHTGWLALLDRAGLMDQLDRQHNLTVFVPTEQVLADDATQELLRGMDSDTLRKVLLHHVTQQATPTCDLSHDSRLRTQAGTDLRVSTYNPVCRKYYYARVATFWNVTSNYFVYVRLYNQIIKILVMACVYCVLDHTVFYLSIRQDQ